MSELERHAFENHYFSCLECAEDVRTGGMLREGVKAGLLEASGQAVHRRPAEADPTKFCGDRRWCCPGPSRPRSRSPSATSR